MRVENSIKNIYTGLIGQAISIILQFVYRTVFIQILGQTYLGVNGLFTNILLIFSFAELGIGQAIIFSLYRPIAENNIPKISALMNLYKKTYKVIGIVIFALGFLFIPVLPYIIKGSAEGIENFYLIYLLFVFNSGMSYFFSYRTSFLSANQKQYVLNKINYSFLILGECIKIVLLVITRNYIVILITQVALTVIQNFYASSRVVKLYPFLKDTKGKELDKSEKLEIFKNVKALIIYKVGTLALNSTDNIIISSISGINAVGLYSNYATLVTSVSQFITIIFSSLTASIGNLNAKESNDKKEFMFNVINLATFIIYSISSVCFLISLNPFIEIWLGKTYLLDGWTVLVIAMNVYIAGMLYAPFNYRQTMGLFKYGKWRPIVSAVINIVVSILLGNIWGIKGVLAGTIVARVTTNGWFDPYIVYKRGFKKSPLTYFVKMVKYLILLVGTSLIGVGVMRITMLGGVFDVILRCVLIILIIGGIYVMLFGRTQEFRYLLTIAKGFIQKGNKR